MSKKIEITIINKSNHKQLIPIDKKDIKLYYTYNKNRKAYIKKSVIPIKKIKFVKKSKKQEKIITKKVIKIVKKRKQKLIKKKEKEIIKKIKVKRTKKQKPKKEKEKVISEKKKQKPKKVKNCSFNYENINYKGYERNKHVSFVIDEDSINKDLRDMEEYFKHYIESEYILLPCLQRMSYIRIHYTIQISGDMDDIRDSSNTTHISFGLKNLLLELENILTIIINLVETYISVNIYKIDFVNYEFKSILKQK